MTRNSFECMPSVMCSNFRAVEKDMRFYAMHFPYLHIDVCDGYYCPNIDAGPGLANALRHMGQMRMDYHFMTEHPSEIVRLFDIQPGDQVSIQLETWRAPTKMIHDLHCCGARVMAALSPATPLSAVEYLWPYIDGLTLMMFEPGYGKQKALPEMYDKIRAARNEMEKRGIGHLRIQVDGNVGVENAPIMARAGADQFVLGSSGLYSDGAIDNDKWTRMADALLPKQGG